MTTDLAYFSGQGKVALATRVGGGAINSGFRYIGDCDALTINTTQKFDDIEESMSGNRIIAAHIPIGTGLALKLNALYWSAANLAIATYGTKGGAVSAGTVAAEVQAAYNDCVIPFAHPQVTSVVGALAGAAGAIASISVSAAGSGYTPGLLALTLSGAPGTGAVGYAYVGADGTVKSAFLTAVGSGYVAPTATITTPGGGTNCTLVAHLAAAALTVTTDYTVNSAVGSVVVTSGSALIPPQPTQAEVNVYDAAKIVLPISTTWAYSYGAYTARIDGFTSVVSEVALRFEGLNMASSGDPVIVNVYRCALDIAKTIAFLEAKHGTLEIGGMVLPDTSKGVGFGPAAGLSQYYSFVKV